MPAEQRSDDPPRSTPALPHQRVEPGARPVRTRAGRSAYWPRLIAALTLLACVTRIPSFRIELWNPDEGFLAVQARLLADGGTLYETVVDRKPPLLPWLYEGAFALFGDDSLLPLKVLAVLAHLATAVLLASLARRRWGDGAGRTAGVLYLFLSIGLNPEDTQAATFEVFMLPATAAAMWLADRRRWAWCGAAVAAAFLAKQTGGAVLLPVLWLWWRSGARRAGILRLVAGAVLPVLAAALATDPRGFLFWTVTGSGAYASFTGSELHVLSRALTNAALLAVACAGLLPAVVRVLRTARTGAADLWLWFGASAVAVCVGFHFFGHYYLQLVPAIALLGTAALQSLPRDWTPATLTTSALACALFLGWGMLAPRPDLAHAERLATAIGRATDPDDRVLVWGMHPETYWLADRTPASRYLTAGFLTNYSGGRNGPQVGEKYAVDGAWDVFRTEMAENPPDLIVDDSRGKPYAPEALPTLRALLAARYEQTAVVENAVIYRRTG
ncbi:glycosyltransferase family 39 protein [Streptomyces sp. B-S-A8]|uniref:Glycosyltransferase family 39 protein n=1 Tax=Streptomyces solicavernae TaxID=3043614 RepID=A0ABT6RYE3_9ACTN|nr:glycosyltransferase family 39 protein [Streptomyces sp. B-S-A8]MDI3389465.1 glycosyltransferase family 39 protein [Streptomyces sp. B-S-A8]